MPAQSGTTTLTRTVTVTVTVAAGVFAPGHLGELTPHLPFELVDDVLEQTGTVQQRLRDLPSRVGVFGATLGSARHRGGGEVALARRLLRHLGPGMLLLADRAFDTNAFLHEAAATGAHLLVRVKATRVPRVLAQLSDGSYLTRVGRRQRGRQLRVIDAHLTTSGADGSRVGDRPGLEQETWALLTVCQLLRRAMVEARDIDRSGCR